MRNTLGVYRTPLIEVTTKCVFSNTTPVGAYRGAGRPEANYYMERLVDTAAVETGIDRIALRRRNHIPPEAMPYKSPNGNTYDSGEFTALLDKALALADWDGFAARKAESRTRGRLRGLGIGDYLELTGVSGREMGGIRFEPDGDCHDHHRHARLRPGPRLAVRPGSRRRGSASRSAGSACCRATATR